MVFYACFTLIGSLEGDKNFGVGIFLNKNLLGYGYRKQTTFFRPKGTLSKSEIYIPTPASASDVPGSIKSSSSHSVFITGSLLWNNRKQGFIFQYFRN